MELFSKNTSDLEKDEIIGELGQLCRNDLGVYLGLPTIVGRPKKQMLELTRDTVKAKIKGWKNFY